MELKLEDDDTWSVITDGGEVIASGLSNAEAWDYMDSRNKIAQRDAETHDHIGRAFSGE